MNTHIGNTMDFSSSCTTGGVSSVISLAVSIATTGETSLASFLLHVASSLIVGLVVMVVSLIFTWFVKPVAQAYFYLLCDRFRVQYKRDKKEEN